MILATILLLLWFGIDLITAGIGLEDYHPLAVLVIVASALIRRYWLAR